MHTSRLYAFIPISFYTFSFQAMRISKYKSNQLEYQLEYLRLRLLCWNNRTAGAYALFRRAFGRPLFATLIQRICASITISFMHIHSKHCPLMAYM